MTGNSIPTPSSSHVHASSATTSQSGTPVIVAPLPTRSDVRVAIGNMVSRPVPCYHCLLILTYQSDYGGQSGNDGVKQFSLRFLRFPTCKRISWMPSSKVSCKLAACLWAETDPRSSKALPYRFQLADLSINATIVVSHIKKAGMDVMVMDHSFIA